MSASSMIQYNRAVAAFYARDRDVRTQLLNEYFQEAEDGKSRLGSPWSQKPNHYLHLAYCYYYREKPNINKLVEILKAVDSQANLPHASNSA